MKSFVKVAARLIGVAFGLGVALFLFSSVAFGHSYDGHNTGCYNRVSYHPVVYHRMSYQSYHVQCGHSQEYRFNTTRCNNGRGGQYGGGVTLSYGGR